MPGKKAVSEMVKRLIGRFLLVCLVCCAFSSVAAAEAATETNEEILKNNFFLHYADRSIPKIAITMDDCNDREWVWKSVELCRQYGITMTFFPNGYNLHPEEREGWLDVLDSGCEIASHGQSHYYYTNASASTIFHRLGRFQQSLDEALGFHYEVRWFRPAYGKISNKQGSSAANAQTVRQYGFDHVLLWDVSQTKPAEVMSRVKNGSILLFHARRMDYNCLEEVIPRLLEEGYQPVTVSALFGFDPPETSDELYVYNKDDYREFLGY